MPSFWAQVRSDFPLTQNTIYLDHASGGPIPRPIYEKTSEYYREHHLEADFAWPRWMRRREEVRAKAAKFINADPSEIAFVPNTSHAMNLAADLLAGKGKVLSDTSEFPASTLPWLWRKSKMVWQKPEKDGTLPLAKMKKLLKPDVRTIVSSFIQYGTGFRQDMKGLGEIKSGRYLVVNATQGFGAFPIDVQKWKADFLTANSFKWFLAGYGGGILYVRKKWLKNRKLKPLSVGWRSVKNPEAMDNRALDLKPEASRYECGSPDFPAIFAMGAAFDYFNSIGMERVGNRILELTDFAIEKLEKAGFEVISPRAREHRSGILIFNAPHPEKLWKKLLADKIYVSVRGGRMRIAPHFYNSFEEIETFVRKAAAYR